MKIERNTYLQKLIMSKHNGMIKIVTGIRRCGKSYLLLNLFREHLLQSGVEEKHIIVVDLEDRRNKELCNPDKLLTYIDSQIKDNQMHYVLLDEIQRVSDFEDVLNSYLKMSNVDVYVTGSNSKFLSTDVITEFRGRGCEVRVHPLSFKEYLSAYPDLANRQQAMLDYMTYGGMPQVAGMTTAEEKEEYLKSLFASTYIRDIKERYKIVNDSDLEELVNVIASGIGGLTNPNKLQDTFHSVKHSSIRGETIKRYLDIMQDAFLIERAIRYDIKGRKYIGTPAKYYFEDIGLRNARINFRQPEESHLMENLIYNELRMRGYSVDVGQVIVSEKDENGTVARKSYEVDFVCNRGFKRYYIQSALDMPTPEKVEQEKNSLKRINDGFQKIIVTGGLTPTHMNDDGIMITNLFDFLLKEDI